VDGIDQSQWFGHSLAVPVGTVTKVPHLVLRVIDWPSANNLSTSGSSISGLFEDHLSLVAEGTILYSAIARFHRSLSVGSVLMLVDVPVFHVTAESGLQLSLYLHNIKAVFAAGTAAWRDVTTCPPLLPHSSNSGLSRARLLSLLDLPSPIPLSRAPRSFVSRSSAAAGSGAPPSTNDAHAKRGKDVEDDRKRSLQAADHSLSIKGDSCTATSLLTKSRIFVVSPSVLFGSCAPHPAASSDLRDHGQQGGQGTTTPPHHLRQTTGNQ
jgi:hypothetical protein